MTIVHRIASRIAPRTAPRHIPTDSAETLLSWFRACGRTDEVYLRGHFKRFALTHAFASETLAPGSTVLDVGAHWLHQAAFFAAAGHRVICADVYSERMFPHVEAAARGLGAQLANIATLAPADAFASLPESSVDAILFSEIIEHITFNPINMWKGFFRVLKPGGRIYVTTPNSVHFARIYQKLNAVVTSCEYGISVDEIFAHGTFGHHWKEFSIPELRAYFAKLSPDFKIDRIKAASLGAWDYAAFRERASMAGPYSLDQLVQGLDRAGAQPLGEQILMDVVLHEKRAGIAISPPW
jgi:2-polyprenyl-3-methyl-5-hydroxy-6-metoxy-1,4-benzoquinol methylase